jgi:hypothetical protein
MWQIREEIQKLKRRIGVRRRHGFVPPKGKTIFRGVLTM